jgi:hypothetical protein
MGSIVASIFASVGMPRLPTGSTLLMELCSCRWVYHPHCFEESRPIICRNLFGCCVSLSSIACWLGSYIPPVVVVSIPPFRTPCRVTFFMTAPTFSSLLASAWVSNNVEGSYKRGVTLGMVISLSVCSRFYNRARAFSRVPAVEI